MEERIRKMSETILITGGAGFIGANFIPYFMEQHPQYKIVNLDKLTYAGNLANLKGIIINDSKGIIIEKQRMQDGTVKAVKKIRR